MKNKILRINVVVAIIGVLLFAITYFPTVNGSVAHASETTEFHYLKLENLGSTSEGWNINVTNTASYDITVIYNYMMCWEGDAENWLGLKHISRFTLKAGASAPTIVSGNGNAGAVAFSYIDTENNKRVITYANNLHDKAEGNTIDCYYSLLDYYAACLELAVLGKPNGWKLQVYNHNDYDVDLKYNKKLCFEGDAKQWKGLKDVNNDETEKKVIPAEGYTDIIVNGNGFAGTAVVSYVKGDNRYITYAYDLDDRNKSLTMRTNIIPA